jgi:hypothetical protein
MKHLIARSPLRRAVARDCSTRFAGRGQLLDLPLHPDQRAGRRRHPGHGELQQHPVVRQFEPGAQRGEQRHHVAVRACRRHSASPRAAPARPRRSSRRPTPGRSTQTFATSTTSIPSINIPPGVAPSAPTNGDVWTTSAGLFARMAGATAAESPPRRRSTSATNSRRRSPTTTTVGGSAWVTRLLETTVTNTISGASLASNKMTLPAGTYSRWSPTRRSAPTAGGNVRFKHRIYNVTDAAAILYSVVGNMAIEDTGGVPAQAFAAADRAVHLGRSEGHPARHMERTCRALRTATASRRTTAARKSTSTC